MPANAGVLDPINFVIPEGTLLAATAPKPVGGYTETILRMIDTVFVALAQACPERVNGCAYGTINALSLAGHRKDGRRWVMFSFFGGGHGGHPEGDGLNHGNAPISTATIPPVEILEAAYPVMFTRWALRPDSGGAGHSRGGLGAIYEIELLEEQADVFLFGERGRFAPPGVLGGADGALNRFTAVRADGSEQTSADGVEVGRRKAWPAAIGCVSKRRAAAVTALPTERAGERSSKRYRERLRHARRGGSVLRHESRRMKRQLVIGVDVGGTFTDLFFLDEATGRSWIGKVPSTRGREADGFLKGIA